MIHQPHPARPHQAARCRETPVLDGLGAFSRTIEAKAGQCPYHRGDVAAQRNLEASALKLQLQPSCLRSEGTMPCVNLGGLGGRGYFEYSLMRTDRLAISLISV